MYQKVLTPLDGSQHAEAILPHVEELAQKFGTQIVLLRVVEPIVLSSWGMTSSHFAGITYSAKDVGYQVARAKNYLVERQDEFHRKGIVGVQSFVEIGVVVRCILGVAKRERVDLIAYASGGHTGLSSIFYGSVAAGIFHQADLPLLLIRSHN